MALAVPLHVFSVALQSVHTTELGRTSSSRMLFGMICERPPPSWALFFCSRFYRKRWEGSMLSCYTRALWEATFKTTVLI
jgi:hypothetical protein